MGTRLASEMSRKSWLPDTSTKLKNVMELIRGAGGMIIFLAETGSKNEHKY